MTENAISINIKPDAAEMIKSKMDADHQIVILALDDGLILIEIAFSVILLPRFNLNLINLLI